MPSNFEAEALVRQAHIDLLNRYAHALDTRDWSALAALFADDAIFAARRLLGIGAGEADAFSIEGRDKLVETIAAIISSLSATHHMLSNYVVDIDPGGTKATASCYLRAYHAGAGERAHLFEESLGRFDLKTVRLGSGWKIRRMDENIMIMLGTPEVFGTTPG
jgi:3-phenylpropionate/cinnamic acid dioxygenase small subunit